MDEPSFHFITGVGAGVIISGMILFLVSPEVFAFMLMGFILYTAGMIGLMLHR